MSAVAVAPDGQTIVTGGKDGLVMLSDTRAQTPIGGHQNFPGNVLFARALPDSKTVLLGDNKGNFSLFDLATLHETRLPFSPTKRAVFASRNFIGVQMEPNLFELHGLTAAGATLVAGLPIEPRGPFAYCAEQRLLAWTAIEKAIHLTSLDRPGERIDLFTGDGWPLSPGYGP